MSRFPQATTVARSLVDQVRDWQRQREHAPRATAPREATDALLATWPSAPAAAAAELRERYGEPDETTTERLVWHHNGPWKRTQVLRDEIPHHFPAIHADFLVQTVAYRVPPERVSDLARFNGSLVADRTAGELSAGCDDEAMNILTLNLAHEIIEGTRTVESARQLYAEEAAAYAVNPPASYTEQLMFDAPTGDPADFDEPAMEGAPERRPGERMADLAPAS